MSYREEALADQVGALFDEVTRLRSALERIASAQPPEGDCTCGHAAWACHKRNANTYCGGVTSWAVWLARDTINWKVVGS